MENSHLSPTWQYLYPAIRRIQELREALSNSEPTSEYNIHKLEFGLNQSIIYSLASLVEGFLTYRFRLYISLLHENEQEKYKGIQDNLSNKRLKFENFSRIAWNSKTKNDYKTWFKILFERSISQVIESEEKTLSYEFLPKLFSLRNFLVHGQLIEFKIPENYFEEGNENSELNFEKNYQDLVEFHEKILEKKFEVEVYFVDRLVGTKLVDQYVINIIEILRIIEDFIDGRYPLRDILGKKIPHNDCISIKDLLKHNRGYDNQIKVKANHEDSTFDLGEESN